MKTKFSLNSTSGILCIFLFTIMIGCKRCSNAGGGGTTKGGTVTGNCEKYENSDDLWNCKKGDCTGTCMLQVRHITPATPGDTVWRDVPGGNVADKDIVALKQELRCDCR
jgi:hypothetical protein